MVDGDAEDAGGALHDLGELLHRVVIEPVGDAEAVTQGPGEQARARGGTDEREARDVEPDGAGGRPLADHDVEEEVLHRGIENLLDVVVEAVNLVDEQDIAGLEVGEDGRKVTRALDGRAARGVDLGAHLVGDHRGERGLAQARGAGEDHVVKRLATALGGLDKHAQVLADALLAAVLVECLRAQGAVDVKVVSRERGAHGARRTRLVRGRGVGEQVLGRVCLPHHDLLPRRLSA